LAQHPHQIPDQGKGLVSVASVEAAWPR